MIVNVFFDTEFTDLTIPSSLVSIGLINESGDRTFYAELTDTYTRSTCSEFVQSNVLPALNAQPLSKYPPHDHIYAKLSFAETQIHLQHWFENQVDLRQLWSDAPFYDWFYIQELFKAGFPSNLIRTPKSVVAGDASLKELFEARVVQTYITSRLIRHHALNDARAAREGWLQIKSFITATSQFKSFLPYFDNLDLEKHKTAV